ncbi:hypothetical protein [Photobacterium leiognathi]|uniref:hypothetical protein n=1 Tax=Photobacterium leiognathi TaxID=553611 RepID=UPI002981641E|nr:hypothetical protein [Photobacterium leiognathi]
MTAKHQTLKDTDTKHLANKINTAFDKFKNGKSVFIAHDLAKLRLKKYKANIRSKY